MSNEVRGNVGLTSEVRARGGREDLTCVVGTRVRGEEDQGFGDLFRFREVREWLEGQ